MTTYNFKDRTGHTHGRLTVIGKAESRKYKTYWRCLCECGEYTNVRTDHLKENRVQSCGCIKDEQRTTHGMSRTSEYKCWQAMNDRCTNPRSKSFHNYGERGIAVCDRWANSFESFILDMGVKESTFLTIERIDNDAGYSPDNCTWATCKEQVCNRRNSLIFTIDGESMCLKDWCRKLGVGYSTARGRLKRGKTIHEALNLI